jgi:hypothetical protein
MRLIDKMNVNMNSIIFTKLLHLNQINSTYFEPTTTTVSLSCTVICTG